MRRSRRQRRIWPAARRWGRSPGGDSAAPLALLSAPAGADRFDACLPLILKHEGGFVNHPRDPGGATNLGITIGTLRGWRGKPVTVDDVRRLTLAEAGAIYRANYWMAAGCDNLPAGMDYAAFDCAVNMGVGRAKQFLAATRRGDARDWINAFQNARTAFYRRLPTFDTFGRGWMARVEDVRKRALAMAAP